MIHPDDWLEPWWLERQQRPDSPDFVPGTAVVNRTHRSWTRIGTLTGPERAAVDPRGLIVAGAATWALDWWIGAEDRWHLPSLEAAVRQRLVDDTPVVETALRVPGGDAIHRAFAVQGRDGPGVAVEIENRTAVPFAVALAIRPVGLLGPGSIRSITLDDTTVLVDGAPALALAKAPARVAGSTAAGGDVVHVVASGLAGESLDGPVTCPDDRAQLALVFPLPHTAVLRAVVPMRQSDERRSGGERRRLLPDPLPSSVQVAAGWQSQTGRGARVEIPEERLATAFMASGRHLVLAAAGDDVASWPPAAVPETTAARVAVALDQLGYPDLAEQLVGSFADRQGLDGSIRSDEGGLAAAGAVLHAIGVHDALTRDHDLVDQLVGPVAKAAHWIDRHREPRRGRRAARGPGPNDLAWAVRGLRDVADALVAVGQPEVAEDALAFAERTAAQLRAADPAGPGALRAGALGALAVTDDWVRRAAEHAVTRAEVGAAVFDVSTRAGLDPLATLDLATVELRTGDRRALDRLEWLLEVASPTVTWPTMVHPRSRGGSAGDGHDPAVTAAFCTFVRRLLVDELGGTSGLALCRVVPDTWLGRSWEVHDVPTRCGPVGFAVRWHGERPALLWELEAHDASVPVTLTVPGLDPTWSTTEASGEALLAPVSPAGSPSDPELSPRPAPPGASSSFS